MISTLGHFVLFLALGVTFYTIAAAVIGARQGREDWLASSRNAVLAQFVLVTLAMFLLETRERPFNIGPLVLLRPPAGFKGHFADKLQVPALMVKHLLMFILVVWGIVAWRRLKKRVTDLRATLTAESLADL